MGQSWSIQVDPQTHQEIMTQYTLDFPYRSNICDLHDYPGNTFPWHWHREVEVFFLREGRLEYHLPGGVQIFEAGQGGFLNSNVLHMTNCRTADSCIQEEQQFAPELIGGFAGSLLLQKYVLPVLETPGLELLKLDMACSGHRPLLEAMNGAYDLSVTQPPAWELALQRQLLTFWQGLYTLTASMRQQPAAPADDQRIKQMLTYISAHYGEHLRLEDIAAAAYLSPRACGRCFQEQLGTTPFAYLLDYRIQRACEQMVRTDDPVGEVALRCGFGSSSYFGRIFREKTGQSPQEYRKKRRGT